MNLEIIQKSIDYIEDNLKTDITAEELSENAGFSIFHFYRLFQSAVGMPVMQYITRRRFLYASNGVEKGFEAHVLWSNPKITYEFKFVPSRQVKEDGCRTFFLYE